MEIKEAKFVISNSDLKMCFSHDKPEYAFIGRSNVGKSSLINMLTNRKSLAMISSKPGKTKLINHFIINDDWYLVDLPGYGFAKTSKTERASFGKLINNYIKNRKELTCLFILIDSRIKPQKNDLTFIRTVGEMGVPIALIFTKMDKLPPAKTMENIDKMKDELNRDWVELPPIFYTSAVKKEGREALLNYIESINSAS